MNDLLDFVIERHGGIDRWNETSTVSATVHVHGGFWAFKGQPGRLGLESGNGRRRLHAGDRPVERGRRDLAPTGSYVPRRDCHA